ncbi:MAG: Holliday junction resolvase RuvX [Clostridia bacterium]|nr:Holliday junction resolvase RuvX [Clostridia bacterium]
MIIVAVDFGDARTGLAVCDKKELAVTEAGFVAAGSYKKALAAVGERVKELGAELLVVGNPINMDGSEGYRSAKCKAFARELSELTGIPAELYDERLTTVEAHKILSENNVRGKKRKTIVDTLSARLILEDAIFLVRQEGKRQVQREMDHYNLDMIIALGYRVQSPIAVRFRRWATQRLHEYIQKGFTMDDERLKQGCNRYFKELLQRIRDIRSSERNFYQQVTDIYATSTDYDPRAEMTKLFFATVQNKMHYAVHEHTAAELIYERVDNEKPFVGMTNFKGNYVTRDDVKIAKNYLSELELQRLNLLTSQFLDYAEFQALEQNPMTMVDWIAALDDQILRLRKNILEGNGTVSHQEAIEKAEREFEIYREREMRLLESDFDKAVKRLKNLNDDPDGGDPVEQA